MIKLFILILSFLHFCRGSESISDILSHVIKLMPETAEKYEVFAGPALQYALMDSEGPRESLFYLAKSIFSKHDDVSNRELYRLFMKGLCDNLNKISIHVIVQSNSQTLTPLEKSEYIKKLRVVSREEEFFEKNKLRNYEYPEKTLRIIIRALKLVDPNVESSFDIVVYFTKYLKTEENIDLALSLMLKGMESGMNPIPFIKFNKSLVSTSSFDNFLKVIYENCRTNCLDYLNLARNIIYGPISDYSTELFYQIFNHDLFCALIISDYESKRLIYRVFNSNTFKTFSVFLSSEPESPSQSNPNISKFKVYFDKQKRSYEVIKLILKYDFEQFLNLMDINDLRHLNLISKNQNCMKRYYEIDPDFVGNCVVRVNDRIFRIIEESKKHTIQACLNRCAVMAYYYFGMIPSKDFTKFLNNVSYEPILDLLLNPDIEKDSKLIHYDNFKNFVLLPHSIVEFDTLDKMLTVLIDVFRPKDLDIIFSEIAIRIFNDRHDLSGDYFLQIFKWLHHIFDSRELAFESIASNFIYSGIFFQSVKVSNMFQDYAAEHKLVSKSYLKIGDIFAKKSVK